MFDRNKLILVAAIPFLACLMAGVGSLALAPPKCDMHVKDNLPGLLWHCVPAGGACSNCGGAGTCKGQVVGIGVESHTCSCGGTTDACWTTVDFDTDTGLFDIECGNTCCSVECPQPAAGAVYPAYVDPCPCGGDEIAH